MTKFSILPSLLVIVGWIGLTVLVIRASGGAVWSFLFVMPGIVIAANLAAWVHDMQVQSYGEGRGLEPVYKRNVHGNGSFFQGYKDPKTGKWPVDPSRYPPKADGEPNKRKS